MDVATSRSPKSSSFATSTSSSTSSSMSSSSSELAAYASAGAMSSPIPAGDVTLRRTLDRRLLLVPPVDKDSECTLASWPDDDSGVTAVTDAGDSSDNRSPPPGCRGAVVSVD